MKTETDRVFLTTAEACEYMGNIYSESYLKHKRCDKDFDGPPYIKIGKYVRYRKADLDNYLESKIVDPKLFRKKYDHKT